MENSSRIIQYNVRKIRKMRKMTQEDLGYVSGLSCAYISKIERNEANITLETLDKVAGGLRVPTGCLFEAKLSDERLKEIVTLQDCFYQLSRLPKEQQDQVISFISGYWGMSKNSGSID